MKNLVKILLVTFILAGCSEGESSKQLPFDSFRFSYRTGSGDAQNPYYFINQINAEWDLLTDISRNPVDKRYEPEECANKKILTDEEFYFECDCTVPYMDGTIDYIIRMSSNPETKEMTEAVILFPEYNVSFSFIDNATFHSARVEGDSLLVMGTSYNPTIENGGNPVEVAINYTWVL